MRDFIMRQLAEMQEESNNNLAEEKAENDAILECAHLIQELEELSVEGTKLNQYRDIDAVNIPLDEDGIIDSLEVCISDGRISDIPADVLVHSESYEYMRSREDFVQESVSENPRQYMESDSEYNARITGVVNSKYNDYLDTIIQEGLFSANKVSISDPAIRWDVKANFGPDPLSKKHEKVELTLPVAYESHRTPNKIYIKQKDSIPVLCDGHPEIFTETASQLMEYVNEKHIDIPAGRGLFEIIVPKRIIVPINPMDKFVVAIEFNNVLESDDNKRYLYTAWTVPIKQNRFATGDNQGITAAASNSLTHNIGPSVPHVNLKNVIDKGGFLREMYREKTPIGRVVQEAIDFGGAEGGDDNPPAPDNGTATPAAVDDTQTATVNGGGDAVSTDTAAPTTDANATTNATTDTTNDAPTADNAVTIQSKDVSGDISNAIQDDINAQNNPEGDNLDTAATDIPEDTLNDNPDLDSSAFDSMDANASATNVDDALNDLNAEGTENVSADDAMGMDITDMSPDDLKQAVQEKVNKMPLSEIQRFLSGDDSGENLGVDDTVTEAFVLTKKNINAELDVCLRKALGDLNDNEKTVSEIIPAFKKDAKKLNRALSKASKMDTVYSETERNQFIKLNKCVADLIVTLKTDADKNGLKVIKRLIKAFTSQAVVVGKIIDSHKNDSAKEPKRVVD